MTPILDHLPSGNRKRREGRKAGRTGEKRTPPVRREERGAPRIQGEDTCNGPIEPFLCNFLHCIYLFM